MSPLLRTLAWAVLLAVAGTFVAAAWTWVLGLAGAPGGRLSVAGARRGREGMVTAGAVLTFLAQAYLALAFAAAAADLAAGWRAAHAGEPGWPVWLVGWYVGTAPALLLTRDRAKAVAHHVRARLVGATFWIVLAGFWVFVRWPALAGLGWPWLPSLRVW